MAVINVGEAASNRAGVGAANTTSVNQGAVANDTGTITSVEMWWNTNSPAITYVTIFWIEDAPDDLTARDYEDVGAVTAGSKQTAAGLDMSISTDDIIGIWGGASKIERDYSGYDGIFYKNGDYHTCEDVDFGVNNGDSISVYGIGATPSAPDQVTNVSATDGTHTDKVVITWSAVAGATGYDVWTGSAWVDVGNVLTYDHTGAPSPTITLGACTASDGTSSVHVALANTGASANNGTSVTYKVRAYNGIGDGDESDTDNGYTGHAVLTYAWYRSAGDANEDYGAIAGATASTYNDTDAPENGDGRYYFCWHTSTDATSAGTVANRGYRLAVSQGSAFFMGANC